MGQALSVFLFVVVGAAILGAAWWYVMTLVDALRAGKPAYVLGEVEVVGDSELAESYKKILPRLIVAKLAQTRNQTNEAVQSLKDARHRRAGRSHLQSQEFVKEKDLPEPFSQPLDIELKVADVDVGPILSFLTDASVLKDTLQVTVSLGSDGQTATLYGHLPGPQGYSFTESSKLSPDDIASTAAAAVVAEVVKREDLALAALEAEAYKTVLSVLLEYARHLKLAPILGDAAHDQLSKLNIRLRDTARTYARWRDLQWLAAEIAEESRQWKDAKVYYTNLATMTVEGHAFRPTIDEKLRKVEAEIRKLVVAEEEATRTGADAMTVLAEQEKQRRSAASDVVEEQFAKPILDLLGLTEALDASGRTIGVVGLPWEEALEGLDYEILGSVPSGSESDSAIRDYATELVQAIRLVARDAKYVFEPIEEPLTTSSTIISLDRLAQVPHLDALLFAYGGPVKSETTDSVLRSLAERGVTVVLPAGNEGDGSIYADVADVALVAGATTQEGEPAFFTGRAKNIVWAPGVDVPMIAPNSGLLEKRSGTAFSAALTAAAVAVVSKYAPKATSAEIREALLATAVPAEGRDEPAIINIPAAIKKLQAVATPTTPTSRG